VCLESTLSVSEHLEAVRNIGTCPMPCDMSVWISQYREDETIGHRVLGNIVIRGVHVLSALIRFVDVTQSICTGRI
jgi:hypothetical protein